MGDWSAVHSFASLPQACRYQPWGPNTEQQTRQFVSDTVEAWSQAPQDRLVYAVCLGGDVVGLGEVNIRSRAHGQGEISYIVHPACWGRGVGTAAGGELLAIGFGQLGLHRIFATCDPRNAESRRVLTKLGMTYEGRHRHTKLLRDGWRDSECFSILDQEWRAAPGSATP